MAIKLLIIKQQLTFCLWERVLIFRRFYTM